MSELKIKNITKISEVKYLNNFVIEYSDRNDDIREWEITSRGNLQRIKNEINNNMSFCDGVMIFATNKKKNKIVLLKEYRVSAGKWVYTLPAGLSDGDEDFLTTSIREFKEETGLDFEPISFSKSRYTSVGITNEKVAVAYGYFSGKPSKQFQEPSEDAEIIIADKAIIEEILNKGEVSVRTALLLENLFNINSFINS